MELWRLKYQSMADSIKEKYSCDLIMITKYDESDDCSYMHFKRGDRMYIAVSYHGSTVVDCYSFEGRVIDRVKED